MGSVTLGSAVAINTGGGSTTVINNLTTNSATDALSAAQGVVLKTMIDAGGVYYDPPTDNPNNSPVLYTRANSTPFQTIPIAQTFTTAPFVYHYNVVVNSLFQVIAISAWGPGSSGPVGGIGT